MSKALLKKILLLFLLKEVLGHVNHAFNKINSLRAELIVTGSNLRLD